MIVLMHTDLPEPVAPAISRWGIFARSATTGSPSRFLPRAMGRTRLLRWYSSPSTRSRMCTMRGMGFGTSIPTAAFPGMGATMRSEGARLAVLGGRGIQQVNRRDQHACGNGMRDAGCGMRRLHLSGLGRRQRCDLPLTLGLVELNQARWLHRSLRIPHPASRIPLLASRLTASQDDERVPPDREDPERRQREHADEHA